MIFRVDGQNKKIILEIKFYFSLLSGNTEGGCVNQLIKKSGLSVYYENDCKIKHKLPSEINNA